MTGKSLLFKIALIGLALVLLFTLGLYLSLKTKKKDLSSEFPYASIIGTEQTIEHECYIAKNYEHFINENPYLLQFNNEFFSEAGPAYKIPMGTTIKITGAKAFTNGTSGTTNNLVFGKIYIEDLQQEVAFEYHWGPVKPLEISDYNNYKVYPLTPWQKTVLPYKISNEDAAKSHYKWP